MRGMPCRPPRKDDGTFFQISACGLPSERQGFWTSAYVRGGRVYMTCTVHQIFILWCMSRACMQAWWRLGQ